MFTHLSHLSQPARRALRMLTLVCPAFFADATHARPEYSDCFAGAATRYGVSQALLRAIAKTESNYQVDAVHFNTDGTHDVGVMQINSSHFERLRALGITEYTLFTHPCTNIAVGASILAGFVKQFGMTWRAVGCYAAGTHPKKEAARIAYAALVQRAFDRIAAAEHPTRVALASPPVAAPAPARLVVLE